MEIGPYQVVKIAKGFWAIEEKNVRAFLFEGTDRLLLVDTGLGTGNIRQVAEQLSKKPISLVNTHTDPDHVGCNKLFDDISMHPAEMAFYATKGFSTRSVRPLWEGDVIDLGNRKLEVVLTPGHTPGSIALLDRENRFILTGDPVQVGMVFMFGPIRDMNAYIASIQKLIGMQNAFDRIYPSHSVLELEPSILPKLVDAAQRLLSGAVEGVPAPNNLPCKLYDCGVVRFLCDKLP